jgi:hypothetical protein
LPSRGGLRKKLRTVLTQDCMAVGGNVKGVTPGRETLGRREAKQPSTSAVADAYKVPCRRPIDQVQRSLRPAAERPRSRSHPTCTARLSCSLSSDMTRHGNVLPARIVGTSCGLTTRKRTGVTSHGLPVRVPRISPRGPRKSARLRPFLFFEHIP